MTCNSETDVLLKELKYFNDRMNDALLMQKISSPSGSSGKIATLEKGEFREITPMLQSRFQFAGKWVNAAFGISFLDINEINTVFGNEDYIEQINVRIDNWDDSVFDRYEHGQITIIGIDQEEYDEIYLVWKDDSSEPGVCVYLDDDEMIFNDFNHFLRYALGNEDQREN